MNDLYRILKAAFAIVLIAIFLQCLGCSSIMSSSRTPLGGIAGDIGVRGSAPIGDTQPTAGKPCVKEVKPDDFQTGLVFSYGNAKPRVRVSVTGIIDFMKPSTGDSDPFGSRVWIYCMNGDTIDGELLKVTDSMLIVNEDARESFFLGNLEALTQVSRSTITGVFIKGNPAPFFVGMGRGALIGAGAGALFGLLQGDSKGEFLAFSAGEKALVYGTALGAVGLVVGGVLGAIASTPDRHFNVRLDEDWERLRKYSLVGSPGVDY